MFRLLRPTINSGLIQSVKPSACTLTSQLRSLSLTNVNEQHIWMDKKKKGGQPYKFEHPRRLKFKHGVTLRDIQDKVDSSHFMNWTHHAQSGRVKNIRARERSKMSEQKFITGIVLKAFKLKPKKPNSGNRAVAKVRLNNGQIRLAYIPFEGSTIVDHARVCVYHHPKKDLVGVKLRVLRGALDSNFRAPRTTPQPLQRKNPGLKRAVEEYRPIITPLKYNYGDF